jgi:hypothetical protein
VLEQLDRQMNLAPMFRRAEALYTPDGERLGSGLKLRNDQKLLLGTTGGMSGSHVRDADADAQFMPVTASKKYRHREFADERPGGPGGRKWNSSTRGTGSPGLATGHGSPHVAGERFTVKEAWLSSA